MPRQTRISVGMRFGQLVTVGRTTRDKYNRLMWDCLCDCGEIYKVECGQLLSGRSKSCGKHVEKHGSSRPWNENFGEYRAWMAAKARCYDPNCRAFKNYGARGIIMCDEWKHSFVKFLNYMGKRPVRLTLERVNNDGNYEPGNCIWASYKVQANNKRNTIKK